MEFCLHYYGVLKSADNASGKHAIRKELHAQIKSLCLSTAFESAFNESKKPEDSLFIEHGSKRYWFLISEKLSTILDVHITLFAPHKIDSIINNGGDIDNRIKTLFDAMRAPSVASEIPKNDDFDYQAEGGMYCLLQDDKLINRISVQSYQDHSPESPNHVRCLIECKTRITAALWGNLNFV